MDGLAAADPVIRGDVFKVNDVQRMLKISYPGS